MMRISLVFVLPILFVYIYLGANTQRIFTSDEEVLTVAETFMTAAQILYALDFYCIFMLGVIKALGMQDIASKINVFCYIIVGLSCAYWFAYKNPIEPLEGVNALLSGLIVGVVITCLSYFYIVFGYGSVNRWKNAIKLAESRL